MTSSLPFPRRNMRDLTRIALVGAAGMVAGFALFQFALPLDRWLGLQPSLSLSMVAAVGIGAWAATATALVRARRLRAQNADMRVALDNMSQGLCMFDRNERLVICNARYRQMYKLPEASTKLGTSLAELLEYRAAAGTFASSVADYRAALIASLAEGRTTTREVTSADGAVTSVVNRPMKGGGWVATHEDITERRAAERERLGLRQSIRTGLASRLRIELGEDLRREGEIRRAQQFDCALGLGVSGVRAEHRIDQDVGVDEFHWCPNLCRAISS